MARIYEFLNANGTTCCTSDKMEHLCDKCKVRAKSRSASAAEDFSPPDPYAVEIAETRAARATPMSRFEERFAVERTADVERQHRAFAELRAAQQPAPRTSAAVLEKYRAIDPYAAELKVLRAKEQR